MSDSVRNRGRREETEVYLGLPSIGPPTVGNPNAHKTNRLGAQVEVKPNSHIFWVRTITFCKSDVEVFWAFMLNFAYI